MHSRVIEFVDIRSNMTWRVLTCVEVPEILRDHIHVVKDNAVRIEWLEGLQKPDIH